MVNKNQVEIYEVNKKNKQLNKIELARKKRLSLKKQNNFVNNIICYPLIYASNLIVKLKHSLSNSIFNLSYKKKNNSIYNHLQVPDCCFCGYTKKVSKNIVISKVIDADIVSKSIVRGKY